MHRRGAARLLGLLLLAALCLSAARPAAAGDIRYLYDPLGRLRAVVDLAGDTAIYRYDATGDLLSITRQPSSQIAVIDFSVATSPTGTTLTIYGTCFSATPSQNTVTFTGVAATVVSATTTSLVVTVPGGATSGPVVVTAPCGTATSESPFTVTAGGPPTITSFSPTIGAAGTAVTITGTNFETTPGNNSVVFEGSGTRGAVTSATETSVGTSVPVGATSGHLSVATPAGKAVSAGDFFVPPGTLTVNDVGSTDRMVIGGTKAVTIGAAGKVALVLFDGTAEQRISLRMITSTGGANVWIYKPDGAVLVGPKGGGASNFFIEPTVLPRTGTYQILLDPRPSTGSWTLALYDVPPDVTATITPGGPAVTVTTTTPGQNARVTFSGTANQKVFLNLTNVTVSGHTVSLLKPDGTTLASTTGLYLDTQTLPTTGTYTILVDPSLFYTGSETLTLYDIVDVTGTITPGGPAVTVTTTTPGQNARVTFSGTAGQRVFLHVPSAPASASFSITNPDGTYLVSPFSMTIGWIDTQTLPSTGTYTILVDPTGTATGTWTLRLYDVPPDVTGTITPGGPAVTVTTTATGQNARLTFSGTVTQRISLTLTSVTAFMYVSITNPDGTTLVAPTGISTSGGFIDTKTLAQTGTYTILVDPHGTNTGSMTLTLYDVPPDVTGTLTINGGAVTVTISVPGQNGSVTFPGTAGQQVTVRVANNTMSTVLVKLLNPSGGFMTQTQSSAASFNLTQQTLGTTGTYSIVVDPSQANTGSLDLSVTSP